MFDIQLFTVGSTLTGSAGKQIFKYTGGDVVIENYSGEDVVQIKSGKINSYSFDGGDLIFHIGENTLTLKNCTNRAVTIKNSSGKTTKKIYSNGYTPQEVIKNFMQAYKGSAFYYIVPQLNDAIQACSNFKSIQEVIDKMIEDCRTANNAETFLRDYCGIILDNEDTGAIIGWDAGGLNIKTAENIIPENSSVKTLDKYKNKIFKVGNVKVKLSYTKGALTAKGKKVLNGLYSWWIEESIKLIEESYGLTFPEGTEINFYVATQNFMNTYNSGSALGMTVGNNIYINMNYVNFNGADDYNGNGVDRTISHEITHLIQDGLGYSFLIEGMAELTHGIDDTYREYLLELASDADVLAEAVKINNVSGGYAPGYMFLRYLAKQVSDSYDGQEISSRKNNVLIEGTSKSEFLTSSGDEVTIIGGKGNDYVSAYGNEVQVFGGKGKDSLFAGRGKNITIHGDAGNDYIYNLANNAVIYGDAGNDEIDNEADNVIMFGGTGNDKIFNLGGDNVTVNCGSGNNFVDSRGNNVKVVTGNGNDRIYIGPRVTPLHSDLVTVNSGGGNDSIENWNTHATINAGVGNDTIINYGASSTLIGGKGNDFISLEGDANKNIISYSAGDGNDTIFGFGSDDSLYIAGSNFSTMRTGDDLIYNIGEGSMTFKNYLITYSE